MNPYTHVAGEGEDEGEGEGVGVVAAVVAAVAGEDTGAAIAVAAAVAEVARADVTVKTTAATTGTVKGEAGEAVVTEASAVEGATMAPADPTHEPLTKPRRRLRSKGGAETGEQLQRLAVARVGELGTRKFPKLWSWLASARRPRRRQLPQRQHLRQRQQVLGIPRPQSSSFPNALDYAVAA